MVHTHTEKCLKYHDECLCVWNVEIIIISDYIIERQNEMITTTTTKCASITT